MLPKRERRGDRGASSRKQDEKVTRLRRMLEDIAASEWATIAVVPEHVRHALRGRHAWRSEAWPTMTYRELSDALADLQSAASPHGPSSGEGRCLDLCMACPNYPWLASPDFLRELNALRDEIVARDPSTLALWQKHQRVAFLLPRLPLPAPPQESSREETT
jgi:hypothetical protein